MALLWFRNALDPLSVVSIIAWCSDWLLLATRLNLRWSSRPHFLLRPVVHHAHQIDPIQSLVLLHLADWPLPLPLLGHACTGAVPSSLVVEFTRHHCVVEGLQFLSRLAYFLWIYWVGRLLARLIHAFVVKIDQSIHELLLLRVDLCTTSLARTRLVPSLSELADDLRSLDVGVHVCSRAVLTDWPVLSLLLGQCLRVLKLLVVWINAVDPQFLLVWSFLRVADRLILSFVLGSKVAWIWALRLLGLQNLIFVHVFNSLRIEGTN